MLFKRNNFPATIYWSTLAFIGVLTVSSSVAFAVGPTLESCPETGVSFDYSYYSCVNDTHIEKKRGVCSPSYRTPLEESITYACGDFHEATPPSRPLPPFSPKLNTCITCGDTGKAVCVSDSSEEAEVCKFARTGLSGPFFDGNLKLNSNKCGTQNPSQYFEIFQYKTGPNSWGGFSSSQACPTGGRKYCVQCNNSIQLCSSRNGTCTEIFEGFPPTSEAIMDHSKNSIATNFLLAIAANFFFLAVVL